MAEIMVAPKNGRRRVQAPRIDFTPMVDLGFILITFFIYTTTIAKPGSLEVWMPSEPAGDQQTVYEENSTVTLLPTRDHRVLYYYGPLTGAGQLKALPAANVTGWLQQKKKALADLPLTFSIQSHRLHVIIKPNDDCKYEDVVTLLDAMNVADVPYYALVDITNEEKTLVSGFPGNVPSK